MSNLPYLVYLFFQKRKLFFIILIIASCGILGYLASRIKLEEDITRFVPSDKNTSAINAVLDNLKSKDKLVIHLTGTNPEQIDSLTECADSIYAELTRKLTSHDYNDIRFKLSDERTQQMYDIFYRNIPLFLEEEDYRKLENITRPDSIDYTLNKDYQALLSPSGMVLGKYIMRDPLNITPLALKKLQSVQLDANFETYNGYIASKDHLHVLFFITPAHAPNETKLNEHLVNTVTEACKKVQSKHRAIRIEPFGATIVSEGNARQLRKDSMLTSLIAVGLIALLLGLYFRNPLLIVFIMFPVAFGMAFSLGILFLTKGIVSAIAIGAGAVVLGIAINYSLHFFTHYKHVRDVKTVLSDLTLPMLIGCTTTVGAFFSLLFAKSEALHDFGQFAGFSLIGAMLFSIIVLPHLLKVAFRKQKNTTETPDEAHHNSGNLLDRITAARPDKHKFVVIGAMLLTVVFAWFASRVEFESDMNKMSFMTDETRAAEKHLDEVNNFAARSVYVFATGNSLNEALEKNAQVEAELKSLKSDGHIKKFSSVAGLFTSAQEQERRIKRWNDFFTPARKAALQKQLIASGATLKFKENAFHGFYEQLNKNYGLLPKADSDTLLQLVFKEFTGQVNGKTSVVCHVKTNAENREKVYAAFEHDPDVVVFDKQNLTSRFVQVIQQDFNTILIITSILVFAFMLLSHGRIELAIINFLPMFISWLWILGIMGIFGIKFNIINIIISTFIFGLGDDYSIFIMDGLLNEFKYGKKNLDSYKSSILLSALITVIGIGTMILAKHPALKSIAAITIIGMSCVVFISFIVQPLIFNWMALNRRHRGLQPYSAKYIFITIIGFMGFVLGALLLTLSGLIIFSIFPAGIRTRKLVFHTLIAYTFRAILACFFNVKKRIINDQNETFAKPAVIVANHQSHIDLALTLQLHPKIIVFTNDWVYNSPFYGFIVKMADYYPASEGYENSLPKLEKLVKEGYSILIFPEGTRSVDGEIHRFHKGAFLLAEKLQLDILPLLIHGAGDAVTKGDFHFKDGALTVKYLKRISPQDTSFGNTYQERTKGICRYMRTEYAALREQFETVDYFRPRLIRNYIFKGPVLEWYCRIKTKLENNYALFESLMPKTGQIVDVGCGYGFLPYMLMYKGRDRNILGVDYDDEKIAIADNCVHKTSRMQFAVGDVTAYEFPQADGFIISDVLHYLEASQQVQVIDHCVAKLNRGGVLVIRDADADLGKRQKGTWYTEFFSTNSGFNKTSGSGLHFVSGQLIKNALAKYPHLEVEVIDNTKLLSNITYVARYK
ncbi:MAG: 1-acyl-sn-glycerol-3-phosphate acyltransferase [Bacteroidetes bacterium]|nr:1-acyl-sn-glycerol-3-phosphate acyltransferase [Bacteroidota bacterium]